LSTIIPFTFPETGQPVRTVTIDGEPWFVGMDVTAILGYSNGRDVLAGLPERMRNTVAIPDGKRGNPNRAVVSEFGVYRLIMRSNLPAAERFQDWLAEEVIPSIRRTGSYNAAPTLPDLTTPQGVLALAERLTDTARQLVEADARIKELEPKALVHDTLMAAADGDVLVRQAAKTLGWQEKQLRHFLLDERLIYRRQATCGATQYDFYAAHADCFNAVEKVVEHTWGSCAHYTLHVTPRGLAFIQMRISKRRAEMAALVEGGVR
jgi:prophage antirepressor-like protein